MGLFRSASQTDKDWQKWATCDPYYSVLAVDKFRKTSLDGNQQDFFQSGRLHTQNLLEVLSNHFGELERESALDFGCGVGRLLPGLAARFGSVVGVDVAPAMLEEARRNLDAQSVKNVTLARSDDELSAVEGSFDLVHSYIVLQHIPAARGRRITRKILEKLKPRGAVALHFSLRRNLSTARELFYRARNRVSLLGYGANLLAGRKWDEPPMQMNEYDLVDILNTYRDFGLGNVLIVSEMHGTCLTAWLCARKGE